MATYLYPTTADLQQIAQDKAPVLTAANPIFRFFPIEERDSTLLMWEQKDNQGGLQQVRGLNGEPPKVARIGAKQYQAPAGVYGEYQLIDEKELTERRRLGTFDQPIDLNDLIMDAQDQLLERRYQRIAVTAWTLAATGTFSVSNALGAVVHTDTFSLTTYSAGTGWSTTATATPLADFRAVKLLARGHSVNLGAGATAFMNQVTANNMLANTNAADLGGRRTQGLATVENMGQVNQLLQGDDLPNIVVYDDGYLNDSLTFVPYIPNNKVVVFGQRPAGQALGAYRMVRNVNNPGFAPGPYMQVVESERPPKNFEVHDGHNGGMVIYYPGSIIIMSV